MEGSYIYTSYLWEQIIQKILSQVFICFGLGCLLQVYYDFVARADGNPISLQLLLEVFKDTGVHILNRKERTMSQIHILHYFLFIIIINTLEGQLKEDA